MAAQSPIIIIGMHRSGTSLITKIINKLGVHIGDDSVNSQENESTFFREVNNRLLRDQGAHWAKPGPFIARLNDKNFIEDNARKVLGMLKKAEESYGRVAENQLWAWKDPRTTVTLPVWLEIFPDAKVLHVIRNGIDVALSLHRREPWRYFFRSDAERMVPPLFTKGYKLWEEYLKVGLSMEPRCKYWMSVRYEDLLAQPYQQLEALCRFMGIDAPESTKMSIAEKLIGRPTETSSLEVYYVRLLANLKLIDLEPLLDVGYESPISRWRQDKKPGAKGIA